MKYMGKQKQSTRFKGAIYEQFARIGKAISNPGRLELLDLLCQGPRTVEALAKEANLGIANTSQQLKVLRTARLIEAEKSGLYVTYRSADDQVCQLLRSLRLLAETRLTEVREIAREFLAGREGLEPVSREGLLSKVREGAVTVLDVRPVEEYRAAHIPGALSVPLKELERRLSDLPADRQIVAYCRGPYCVLAVEAVEMLRAHGFEAFRLEQSVQDWQAQGFPVAVGEDKLNAQGKTAQWRNNMRAEKTTAGSPNEQPSGRPVYLDYNATTPLAPEVVAAMRPFLEEHFGNPSSGHRFGTVTRAAVEKARSQVADLLDAQARRNHLYERGDGIQ